MLMNNQFGLIQYFDDDLNLSSKTFENILFLARKELKRELTKKERRLLHTTYLKACNNCNLVVYSNRHKPLNLNRNIWDILDGRQVRLLKYLEITFNKTFSVFEQRLIKSQWPALTSKKRFQIKDCSHGYLFNKNILQRYYTGRKSGSGFSNQNTFDYKTEKQKLLNAFNAYKDSVYIREDIEESEKKVLCSLEYAKYKQKLDSLKLARKEHIEQIQERIEPTWSYHVVHNAKGSMSTRAKSGQRAVVEDRQTGTIRNIAVSLDSADRIALDTSNIRVGVQKDMGLLTLIASETLDINRREAKRYDEYMSAHKHLNALR